METQPTRKAKPSPPTPEQQLALQVLIVAGGKLNESLTTYSSWLAAGVGAAFALIVSDYDKVSSFICVPHIRLGMVFFLVALGVCVAARLLSAVVSAAVEGAEKGTSIGKDLGPQLAAQGGFDLPKYFAECERAFIPPLHLPFKFVTGKAEEGDWVTPARIILKLVQMHVALIMLESALVIAAGYSLIP